MSKMCRLKSLKKLSLAVLVLCLFWSGVVHAALRESLSLDGTWTFSTDPENVGDREMWYQPNHKMLEMPLPGYAETANGTIQVPGIWDNQGYGAATDKVHHNYVGKGWYKKTVDIPDSWHGEKIFFCLNSISRYARVWVNGHSAGPEAIGFVGPHEWEISSWVSQSGPTEITVCVDSFQRWNIDVLFGATSLNDYMEIAWGGIWGHAWLESRPALRMDSVYLRSNIADPSCTADVAILNEGGSTNDVSIKLEVFDLEGEKVAESEKVPVLDNKAAATAKFTEVKLWTPKTPVLYNTKVSLYQGDTLCDTMEQRTGIREIKIEGCHILLNGKRIFLRGYGDDHIYPYEFSMPTDKEMLKKRLLAIKAYGFNHVRNHSAIHPHEYFEACDEVGMLTTGEFVIGYPHLLPGEGNWWKERTTTGTDPKPALALICERWASVVKDYRHHPSILSWVGGNELIMLGVERWEKMPLRYDMKKIANDLDPDRYFSDCDGDFDGSVNNRDRDTLDIMFFMFNEWTNPIVNQEAKFKTRPLTKPVISHESGNFLTFSRPSQIEKFSKNDCNFKPFWMTAGHERLEELGLLNEAEDWAAASEQHYLVHHKYNVEGMRLNDDISGYHWWLFQDYWTTSNGIFDLFFEPKSIHPEQITPFNSETIVLQKGLQRSYRSGEEMNLSTFISNYSGNSLSGTETVTLSIQEDSQAQTYDLSNLATGKLSSAGEFKAVVPNINEPKEATLTISFKTPEREYTNSWTSWFFPKETVLNTGSVPVYRDPTVVLPEEWKTSAIPEDGTLPANAVYVTSWLDSRLSDALNRGAGIVLLGGSQLLPAMPVTYQTTWWKAGENSSNNNVGTYLYSNPVTGRMANENWCGIHWYELLQDAQKYDLEQAECRPEVLIRALPSLVLVEDKAILYKVGLGKGTLYVSGLNHTASQGTAANETILASLIEDAARFEQPKEKWDINHLFPPVKIPEGTVLGFTRILNSQKVEWGLWKNFKGENASLVVCRQDKLGNNVQWETDIVDPNSISGETVTFIFSGALGFNTEPATAGHTLTFNGKDEINFNHPTEMGSTSWKSENGRMELSFDVRKTETSDLLGVFRLTVPKEELQPNAKQKIEVRSNGEGSRRWFGLYFMNDLL